MADSYDYYEDDDFEEAVVSEESSKRHSAQKRVGRNRSFFSPPKRSKCRPTS